MDTAQPFANPLLLDSHFGESVVSSVSYIAILLGH